MARVILHRSPLGETEAVSPSAFRFVGYGPSLTSGGTIQMTLLPWAFVYLFHKGNHKKTYFNQLYYLIKTCFPWV